MRILSSATSQDLCNEALLARGIFFRIQCLLKQHLVNNQQAWFLENCCATHILKHHGSLEFICVDGDLRIINIVESLQPQRFLSFKSAKYLIQVKSGACRQYHLFVGQQLRMPGLLHAHFRERHNSKMMKNYIFSNK